MLQLRELNVSHTLGCVGRTCNPSGYVKGDPRTGQITQKEARGLVRHDQALV
jgi:hypothetical protein